MHLDREIVDRALAEFDFCRLGPEEPTVRALAGVEDQLLPNRAEDQRHEDLSDRPNDSEDDESDQATPVGAFLGGYQCGHGHANGRNGASFSRSRSIDGRTCSRIPGSRALAISLAMESLVQLLLRWTFNTKAKGILD
jgi:hypothetical protein